MRSVAALCRELTADRRSDGELLAVFRAERSESAFLELLRRHGPLVWSTCQRLLPDPADAEDAFQATFLVLVQQSRKLTHSPTVGPWLYRVAVLTARSAKRKNARQLVRQQPLHDQFPADAPNSDLKVDLDDALLALPERYRDALVLCHLQGYTRREAAERLGCPEGTLSAWLSRGLEKLRVRLRDRDPARVLAVPLMSVPAVLATTAAKAAVAVSLGAASVPPVVSSLV
ncbi:MAG: sigma-70 family RNA polymerase sigma factor, partial [Gemmataceae bacterium]|nr:sigma-70 family RNA polymerase sigma factor [Gemmataceae bacterium]